MPDIYQKSGYLNSPFRLFYLEDLPGREYTYHYHDFHKLLIFLNGTVSYRVEGREYDLKPGDQVLIPAGEIHCPVVHPSATYTRLIAYISPDYFSTLPGECDLSGCFSHALGDSGRWIFHFRAGSSGSEHGRVRGHYIRFCRS